MGSFLKNINEYFCFYSIPYGAIRNMCNVCSMIRFFLLLFFSIPYLIFGQIKFKHYKADNGLPHDFTYQVFEDDQGYIWIGTDDGLAKFNGQNFKVFDRNDGFRSDFVIDLKKYKSDTLALATWKGGIHFMKNDSILIPKIKGDSIARINTVFILGDDIFSSNYGRHTLYEKQSGLHFIKRPFELYIDKSEQIAMRKTVRNNFLNNIAKTVNGSLYFYRGVYFQGTRKYLKGIYKYTPQKGIVSAFPFFEKEFINDFGTYDANTYYATIKDRFYIFNETDILSEKKYPFENNTIHQYAKTSYCEVFVVRNRITLNDQIFIYDTTKKKWEDLIDRTGSKILVSDVFVDMDENIWITSRADGLYQVSADKGIISNAILDKEYIQDISIGNKGVLFFLGLKKVYGYHKETKELATKGLKTMVLNFGKEKINNSEIFIYLTQQGKIADTLFDYALRQSSSFYKEKDSILFKYSTKCLYYTNREDQKIKICVNDHDKDFAITDVEVMHDQILIAVNTNIMRYDQDSGTYQGMLLDQDSKSNIQEIIYSKKRGGVWIHTTDGLLLSNNKGLVRLGKKDGLESNKINDIFLDHRETLWIATQKGFSMYKDGMFYNFGKKEGLQSSYVSKIIEDNEHQIWVAGNKGVSRIDNTKPYEPITPPQLIVNKIRNQFSVDVIDYSGKQITTQYRTNSRENWKPFENKVLDVKNYGMGDYNVQFRSRNPNSNWVYSIAYPFAIEQRWFKNIWFILSLSLLSTTLISSIIYLQLRRVNNRNKLLQDTIAQSISLEKELSTVRENVAQDFHDELGNKLAGITVMSDLLMKDSELNQSKSIDMIAQVRKDAKDLYFGIKDFVWSIDAKSDDLKELMIYLIDFGEELFQYKGIVFKTEKQLHEEHIKLPYYWSRQLLLLYKEAMTNSLKHSKATEVLLGFYVDTKTLKICFSDNGVGFDASELKRKNGLLNMEKRTMKIGGELIVDSQDGTSILFKGKI